MPMQWQIREESPTEAGRIRMEGRRKAWQRKMRGPTGHPSVRLAPQLHRLNMFSKDLASHLQALEQDTISVTLRDHPRLWTMRGFSTLDIAGLKQWDASRFFYKVSDGGSDESENSDPWDASSP